MSVLLTITRCLEGKMVWIAFLSLLLILGRVTSASPLSPPLKCFVEDVMIVVTLITVFLISLLLVLIITG